MSEKYNILPKRLILGRRNAYSLCSLAEENWMLYLTTCLIANERPVVSRFTWETLTIVSFVKPMSCMGVATGEENYLLFSATGPEVPDWWPAPALLGFRPWMWFVTPFNFRNCMLQPDNKQYAKPVFQSDHAKTKIELLQRMSLADRLSYLISELYNPSNVDLQGG